jgi:DUF4097 and DUF4098 domain-containing protein YvlB
VRIEGGVVTVTAPAGAGVTEIVVPRTSRLDVRAGSGSATIENVANVSVKKPSGELQIRGIAGDVFIEMSSGQAVVREVGGRLTAVTGTANLDAAGVAGDLTVTSINGNTTASCVGGAVSVSDTNGVTELTATRGDVSVDTTSGRASWTGTPLPSRRYRLETLSGVVSFAGRGPLGDAAVALSTHAGRISSEVVLPRRETDRQGRIRRLEGVFGRGSARISLDAFEGAVELQWKERGGNDEDCSGLGSALRGNQPGEGRGHHE